MEGTPCRRDNAFWSVRELKIVSELRGLNIAHVRFATQRGCGDRLVGSRVACPCFSAFTITIAHLVHDTQGDAAFILVSPRVGNCERVSAFNTACMHVEVRDVKRVLQQRSGHELIVSEFRLHHHHHHHIFMPEARGGTPGSRLGQIHTVSVRNEASQAPEGNKH